MTAEEVPLQVDEGDLGCENCTTCVTFKWYFFFFLELEEREIAMSKEAACGPQRHLALKGTAIRGAGSDCRRKGTDTGLG